MNFDCTQIISLKCAEGKHINIHDFFDKEFFSVLDKSNIRPVKLTFFSRHLLDEVYELKNDNFMGEFEDWVNKEDVPILIADFINKIENIFKNENVIELNIFLSYYADVNGRSTYKVINSTSDTCRNDLFIMSKTYYGPRYDTIILKMKK